MKIAVKVTMGLCAALILLVLWLVLWRIFAPGPQLQAGDLIFQTSRSGQSNAILLATGSAYTHMGIIEKRNGQWYVLEANGPVQSTPLRAWTKRGRLGRYSVYRHRTLTPDQAQTVLTAAHRYDGRAYDLWFSSDNREIYCSELPRLAFAKVGLDLGRMQPVGDLNIHGKRARAVIEKRWRSHPACKGLKSFDACYARILKQELVTPVSIARDGDLRKVFTNYLF